jgi:DNA polymerase V
MTPLIAKEIYTLEKGKAMNLPFIEAKVPAGFPSPAAEYFENKLDLNEYLIRHPEATYFIRVEGDSMIDAKIYDGDLLIVDRALEPVMGKVVIANINGELTVKKIDRINGKLFLVAENEIYKPIEITEEKELLIWGVVVYAVHKV